MGTSLYHTVLERRNKSKEKFEFDDNNAQIFRLRLDEVHLQTQFYFNEYHNSFVLPFVGMSFLLLYKYLGKSEDDSGVLADGNLIPVVFRPLRFVQSVCVSCEGIV